MAIVYQKDKRSGITYAYESISFWDKEKKQSRSKRTLLGRVEGEPKSIIATDGRGRKKKRSLSSSKKDVPPSLKQHGIFMAQRTCSIKLESGLELQKTCNSAFLNTINKSNP